MLPAPGDEIKSNLGGDNFAFENPENFPKYCRNFGTVSFGKEISLNLKLSDQQIPTGIHIFYRQLDFSSEPGVANEILEFGKQLYTILNHPPPTHPRFRRGVGPRYRLDEKVLFHRLWNLVLYI